MALVKYHRAHNNFDNFVNRFFNDFYTKPATEGYRFSPSVDVAETDAAFEVQVVVPGIAKEDINISLEESKLSISGERKLNKEDDQRNYRRVESTYGSFNRSFYLPDNVDGENINAAYTNGILLVTRTEQRLPPTNRPTCGLTTAKTIMQGLPLITPQTKNAYLLAG